MHILSTQELEQINQLADMEANLINMGFNNSKVNGILFLRNSIESFENFLKNKYGNIVISMSSHYRFFIINLLKKIEDKNLPIVHKELLS